MPEIFVKKFTYIIGTRQNASIKFDTNHNGIITFKYQQEISYVIQFIRNSHTYITILDETMYNDNTRATLYK